MPVPWFMARQFARPRGPIGRLFLGGMLDRANVGAALAGGIPLFGVCLGLQGIVEYYGGRLSVLPTPMHGKPSMVNVRGGKLFDGLPERFEGGRYHSLYADRGSFPDALAVTAESDEGIVMAAEHPDLPVAAVQFHPESILTVDENAGLAVVMNVIPGLGRSGRDAAV